MGHDVPTFGVFDPLHVSDGASPGDAIRDAALNACVAEKSGFERYWVGEQHFDVGYESSSPGIVLSTLAHSTSSLRLGVATVQLATRLPMTVAEDFATLAALHGSRFDIGLGRPAGRYISQGRLALTEVTAQHHEMWELQKALAVLDPNVSEEGWFARRVEELISLLNNDVRTNSGAGLSISPSNSGGTQVWMMGVGAGRTSALAARLGLPFASAMHISPDGSLKAVADYRERAGAGGVGTIGRTALTVIVLPTVSGMDSRLAKRIYEHWFAMSGYGFGAVPISSPAAAAAHVFEPVEAAYVSERSKHVFVGDPRSIASRLREFAHDRGVDELLLYVPIASAEQRGEALRKLAAALEL